MSAKNRVKDLLPVLVVFFVIAMIGTFMVIEFIVNEPIVVPSERVAIEDAAPKTVPTPFVPRH